MSTISDFSIMTNGIYEPGLERENILKLSFLKNTEEENGRVLKALINEDDVATIEIALKHLPRENVSALLLDESNGLFAYSARCQYYKSMKLFLKYRFYPSQAELSRMATDSEYTVKVFKILSETKGISLDYSSLAETISKNTNSRLGLKKLKYFKEKGEFSDSFVQSLPRLSSIHGNNVIFKGLWKSYITGTSIELNMANSLLPLACIRSNPNLGIITHLLKSNADPNQKTRDGNPLLFTALEHSEVVDALLKAGADPNAVNNKGQTPLQCIVNVSRSRWINRVPDDSIRILINHHANVNVRDKWGFTPLDWTLLRDARYKKTLEENNGKARRISRMYSLFFNNVLSIFGLPEDSPRFQV